MRQLTADELMTTIIDSDITRAGTPADVYYESLWGPEVLKSLTELFATLICTTPTEQEYFQLFALMMTGVSIGYELGRVMHSGDC